MKSLKYLLLFYFMPFMVSAQNTVVDVIVNSNVHNTLEAAVIAADLAGTLSGEGPFTVFAPTDDAFAAIPADVLAALLANPSGDLTDILLYHVLAANVQSGDLSDGQLATTINGSDVLVSVTNNGIFINNAQVIVADIVADNGVVHVIDAVLVPELTPPTGTAKVQFICSAEFETIRIFAGGEQVENFIAYRMATDFLEIPAGAPIEIELRSRKSYQPADPIFRTLTFEPNETYVVGITGTFDTSDEIPVELVVFDQGIETAPDDIVGVQLLHGSYDAPTIDVVSSGSSIFDDVSYGEFGEDYLLIPADDGYRLDITTADNSATVASYELNVEFWKRKSMTIFATGSLLEGTFEPWVALSTGGTYPLPEWTGLFSNNIASNATVGNNNTSRMLIAPNPASDYTILEFETAGEGPVRINLFNSTGKLIQSKDLGTLNAGIYREEIQLNELPEGTYFIKTYLNGKSEAMNLIKSY